MVAIASLPDGKGYWIVTNTGAVQAFGKAGIYPGKRPERSFDITAIASSADGNGYWLVASSGAVAAFGDARSHGSWQGKKLTAPVVAIAATPNGKGYWLATADGTRVLFRQRRAFTALSPRLPSPHRSWVWRPLRTGTGTGWFPPTALFTTSVPRRTSAMRPARGQSAFEMSAVVSSASQRPHAAPTTSCSASRFR